MKRIASFAARLALALVALAAGFAHAAPSRWTLHDAGSFHPVIGSHAWDINNRGDVVGTASRMLPGRIAPINRCFLWQNGAMQDIGAPFVTQLGTIGDHCQAIAINDRGTIAALTGYDDEIFLFKDGQWTGKVGNGIAMDINRSEHMARQYWNGSASHAFLIKDGVQHDLGTLGGPISGANAINNRGVVVGLSEMPQSSVVHAFVYKDGAMRDLGTLGGEDSVATDINDRGAVVGVLDGKGFLHDDGVLTLLDDLPQVKAAGWSGLRPRDVSDRGWITGVGAHNGKLTAFVLVPR